MSKPEKEVHVFSGEATLTLEDRLIIPHAVWHPPAARGDLLRVASSDVIILYIDAAPSRLQPSYKEIQALLKRGAVVVGAGREGALRAMELESYGMAAPGTLPALLKEDVLAREDAILPAACETGAPSLSLAHLAHLTSNLVEQGLWSATLRTCAIDQAGEIPAADRRLSQLVKRWRIAGMDKEEIERLTSLLFAQPVDICRQDALHALNTIYQQQSPSTTVLKKLAPPTLFFCPTERSAMGQWEEKEFIRDNHVLATFRLFSGQAKQVHQETIQHLAMLEWARDEGGKDNRTKPGHLLGANIPSRPSQQDSWALGHSLSSEEKVQWLNEESVLAQFEECKGVKSKEGQAQIRSAALRRVCKIKGINLEGKELPPDQYAVAWLRFRRYLDPMENTLIWIKAKGLYQSAANCWRDISTFNRALATQNPEFQCGTISTAVVRDFFCDLWNIPPEEFHHDLRLRGFRGERDFFTAARRHYAFALHIQQLGCRLTL